jgi:hypothetical protein
MTTQAILYGWINTLNGKKYIGYHKTDEINDGYLFSSVSKELRNDWSYGRLERHIIWAGTSSECITLENFILKRAKEHHDWNSFYNDSVGGGKGCTDFSIITDSMKSKAYDFLHDEMPPVKMIDTYEAGDVALCQSIANKIKKREYPTVTAPADKIDSMGRNQVRMELLDSKKVEAIATYMREHPADARVRVSPIVVCTYPDGVQKIIDGNHTIKACLKAGWLEVSVIYLSYEDFDSNPLNVNNVGYLMNDRPYIATGNTKKDCQRWISQQIEYFEERETNFDPSSAKFRATLDIEAEKLGTWSKSQISGNLKVVLERRRLDAKNAGRNFIKRSDKDIETIEKECKAKGVPTTKVGSSAVYYNGVGAAIRVAHAAKTKEAMIIIYHNNIEEYDSWPEDKKELDSIISTISDYNIQYTVLSCFAE